MTWSYCMESTRSQRPTVNDNTNSFHKLGPAVARWGHGACKDLKSWVCCPMEGLRPQPFPSTNDSNCTCSPWPLLPASPNMDDSLLSVDRRYTSLNVLLLLFISSWLMNFVTVFLMPPVSHFPPQATKAPWAHLSRSIFALHFSHVFVFLCFYTQ